MSESTKLAAPLYVYRALDKVQVKGKSALITIYEVVAHVNTVSHDYLRYLSLLDEVFSLLSTKLGVGRADAKTATTTVS